MERRLSQINKIVFWILVLQFLGCNPREFTIKKYIKSKNEVHKLHGYLVNEINPDSGESFNFYFSGAHIYITYSRSDEQFPYVFNMDTKDNYNLVNILVEPDADEQKFYMRHPERVKEIKKVLSDSLFKQYFRDFIRTGVKGFIMSEDYFFLTFGAKGVKLKHPDINAGILITKDTCYKSLNNYVEEIDSGVYLFDSVL